MTKSLTRLLTRWGCLAPAPLPEIPDRKRALCRAWKAAHDDSRLSQLDEVVSDAARYDPDNALIVAADLNLDASKHGAGVSLLRTGFHDALPAEPTPTTLPRPLEGGRPIDWAFVRVRFRHEMHRYTSRSELRIASDPYRISFKPARAR
jgi:hypothetical protein